MPERYSLNFDVDDVHVNLSSVGRLNICMMMLATRIHGR
jgi:hypothetical protein